MPRLNRNAPIGHGWAVASRNLTTNEVRVASTGSTRASVRATARERNSNAVVRRTHRFFPVRLSVLPS